MLKCSLVGPLFAVFLAVCATAQSQSFNGAIAGVVRDNSRAVVPDVALTLRNVATDHTVGMTRSGPEGEYAFRNLAPAKYEIHATKPGFRHVTHPDIEVTLGSVRRVEIALPIGAQEQHIEVVGGSSVLSTSATQEHGITPETLQQLPLAMASGPRAAAAFATLMPGVATGGGSNPLNARINGGLQSGDEATVDGVSMQQGFMSQGGMISIYRRLPDVAGHGQRGQGPHLELRTRIRRVDVRANHGGDEVRRQLVPWRGLRVPPR